MRPFYEDDAVTIYHADYRELLPGLTADAVLTDPPYGIGKASWDAAFPPLGLVAQAAPVLGLMPGVWNLGRCGDTLGRLRYRGCLAAHLINGMTRGPVGFGNWIPCLLYSAAGVSLWTQDGDSRTFVVGREPKVDHPSPKPLNVTTWFLSRLPGESVLDPFMGSGTTLRAAKDLRRRAVGVEIEERYCELAARRMGQEVLAV